MPVRGRVFRWSLALAAGLALLSPGLANAHPQQFTMAVGRDGYEGTVHYELNVEAGHEVTLTFTYADGDLPYDNPHEISVEGLGLSLPTIRLSRENPTASLTFTPTQTGTLRIVCVIPCLGMENLVGGTIRVVPPETGGLATQLTLELSPKDEGSFLARVTLTVSGGDAVADAPVVLVRRTSVGGELVLGSPSTMADGSAVMRIPALEAGTVEVRARYAGGGVYASSAAASSIQVPGVGMDHTARGLTAASSPPVLALALTLVLGGVWSAYAYVVAQVVGIRRGAKEKTNP